MKGLYNTPARTNDDMLRAIENIRLLLKKLPIYFGYGTPENQIVANVGSLFLRLDGGASTTLYIKESSEKSSGWRAV